MEKGDTSTGPTNSSASARRAPAAPGVARHAPGARSFGHAATRNGAMKAMRGSVLRNFRAPGTASGASKSSAKSTKHAKTMTKHA